MELLDDAFIAINSMHFQSHIERKGWFSLLPLIESEGLTTLLCSIAAYQLTYSAGNSDPGIDGGLILFILLKKSLSLESIHLEGSEEVLLALLDRLM